MIESITARVGRIVSGSFNALVDAVENAVPETVMEQAIREIDDVIDDVRGELGKEIANKHLANTRLSEQNKKHKDLGEKIDLAVSEGRDDLAETAIATQLDVEAQIPILEATISECSTKELELEGYISGMQAKKREMKEELRQYRESRNAASNGGAEGIGAEGTSKGTSAEGRMSKAESAFGRVLEKATGIPGGVVGSDRTVTAQLAELEDMSRKNRIQERLAAAKGRREKQ